MFAILLLAFSTSLLVYLFLLYKPIHFINPLFSSRVAHLLVLSLAIAYVLIFGTLSVLRYLTFNTDGFDLSVFDQVIWNSLCGRLFQTTIIQDISLLLAQRFSPILLAFVPLYALWSSPIVLIIVQTLAIAVGVFPIFWFARSHVSHSLAVVVALTYFLSPALQYVNLEEFHEIALAIPIFTYATFFVLRQQYKSFLVCVAIALLVKEDIGLIVIFYGLYLLFVQRQRWLGLSLCLFGMVWSMFLLQCLIPYFGGNQCGSGAYYYFGYGVAAGRGRYDYLGHSLHQIVLTMLTRPDIVLQHVVTPAKIEYVTELLVPLGLLPLVGFDIFLIGLPTLIISVLSDYAPQFSIKYHYTASLLPFLFFGMVIGLQRLLQWRLSLMHPDRDRRARLVSITLFLLLSSGASYYLLSAGPLALNFQPSLYVLDAHTTLGASLLKTIPTKAIVSAQGELTPHLSSRQYIYGFPAPHLDYCRAEYLAADTQRYQYQLFKEVWAQWLDSGYFEIITQQDGYIIARRKAPNIALGIQYSGQMTLALFSITKLKQEYRDAMLCAVVEWHQAASSQDSFIVRMQLLDARGHLFGQAEYALDHTGLSQSRVFRDQYMLAIPPTAPSGIYQVTLGVYRTLSQDFLAATDRNGMDLGFEPVVAAVTIEKNTANVTASQIRIDNPFFVDMGEIRLLGYTALPRAVRTGDTLPVGLYWRARGRPQGDYEVVVQLRDTNARVVVEEVSRPAAGTYPTTEWAVGEVLLDWHDLKLYPELATGEYELWVVLREVSTYQIRGEAPIASLTIQP